MRYLEQAKQILQRQGTDFSKWDLKETVKKIKARLSSEGLYDLYDQVEKLFRKFQKQDETFNEQLKSQLVRIGQQEDKIAELESKLGILTTENKSMREQMSQLVTIVEQIKKEK